MTTKQVAVLCCKVLSLQIIFSNVQAMAMNVSSQVFTPGQEFAPLVIISFAINLMTFVIGLGLWIYAEGVAAKMVTPTDSESPSPPLTISSDQAQAIAFSVVGLSILVHAIPQIAGLAGNFAIKDRLGNFSYTDSMRFEHLVVYLVEMMAGFWLLLGSQGLVGIVNFLREAGLKGKK